jgi:hypothetical protein
LRAGPDPIPLLQSDDAFFPPRAVKSKNFQAKGSISSMQDNAAHDQNNTFLAAAAGVFGYGLKFAGYNFLTFVVLLCFGIMVFAYLTLVGPQVPSLKILSPLLPIDASGNTSLDASDILRVYSILSLVFMFLGIAAKGVLAGLRRIIQRLRGGGSAEPSSATNSRSLRQTLRADLWRIILSSGLITLIFLAACAGIPSAKMAEGASRLGLLGVLGVFYGIALVMNFFYVLIDEFSDLILDWARSNLPWPTARDQVA